jgi:dienelactone hydrolase
MRSVKVITLRVLCRCPDYPTKTTTWGDLVTDSGQFARAGEGAPLEAVPSIQAELLIVLAEKDERINASWPAYEDALKAAGIRYRMLQPKGTQHGFHNDTTPRYHLEAAADVWKQTLDLFERRLR